jgi:Na+-driven multidrug efflux pump
MELQVILMFLLSLMLVVVTAWSVGTFLRLNSASKKYNNNKVFESACQLSKEYVATGMWMGVVILLLSLVVFAMSSYNVYQNYKE